MLISRDATSIGRSINPSAHGIHADTPECLDRKAASLLGLAPLSPQISHLPVHLRVFRGPAAAIVRISSILLI